MKLVPKFDWDSVSSVVRFVATIGILVALVVMNDGLDDLNANLSAARRSGDQTRANQCQLLRILGQPEEAMPPVCFSSNVLPLWEPLDYIVIGQAAQHEKTQRCIAQIEKAINSRTPIDTECE